MEGLAHGVQAPTGVDHDGLGGLEGFAGGQLPVEAEGVDAQGDPGGVPGIHLGLGQEVAGVNEGEADDLALVLVRAGAAEHDEGIVVMGGVAPGGLHGLGALLQAADLHPALPGPGPGEMDEFIAAVGQVQAEAHGVGQVEVQGSLVDDPGGTGQGRPVREEGVMQVQGNAQQLIPQADGEGFRLAVRLAVGGGQALQGRLAGGHGVREDHKVRDPAAVGLEDLHGGAAVIGRAVGGVLLPGMLQGEEPVVFENAGGHGPAPHLQQVVEALPVPDGPAEVQLPQGPVGKHLHNIAD